MFVISLLLSYIYLNKNIATDANYPFRITGLSTVRGDIKNWIPLSKTPVLPLAWVTLLKDTGRKNLVWSPLSRMLDFSRIYLSTALNIFYICSQSHKAGFPFQRRLSLGLPLTRPAIPLLLSCIYLNKTTLSFSITGLSTFKLNDVCYLTGSKEDKCRLRKLNFGVLSSF